MKRITNAEIEEKLAGNLRCSNSTMDEEENLRFSHEWFGEFDVGETEEVEISIFGSEHGPDPTCLGLARDILPRLSVHEEKAMEYLALFFPHHERDGYCLSEISFGAVRMLEGHLVPGFSFVYIYGDAPDFFQVKTKFKEDGWPIGLEAGPL